MEKITDSVSSLKGFFSGPQELLGIDIGSYSVKAVWLSATEKTCKLHGWGHAVFDINPEAAPEERKFVIAQTIKDLLGKKNITNKNAATSIAGNSVIVRYITIPKMPKASIAGALPTEAEPFIPFDIKEVNLSYHLLGDTVEEGQKKMEIVLVAAKKEVIKDKMDVLTAINLNPLVIDVDAFALETALERAGHTNGAAVLTLNIGHKTTNLSIVERGVTRVARDILIAGNAMTKAVAKAMSAEPNIAQELKHKYGLKITAPLPPAPDASDIPAEPAEDVKVSDAVTEVLKDLVGEVRRSVDFYCSQGANRSIAKVFLAGGSANLPNLAPFMSSELKAPVEVLNPLSIVTETASPNMAPKNMQPSLAVATGLALRKLWDWQ